MPNESKMILHWIINKHVRCHFNLFNAVNYLTLFYVSHARMRDNTFF